MSLDKGEVATTKVARNSVNTVIVKRLRMFVLNFAPIPPPPDPNSPDKDTRTLFEIYLDGMDVESLKNAYVVFIPTSEIQGPAFISASSTRMKPDVPKAFYCRTSTAGELMMISKSQIDDESTQPSRPQLFKEGDCLLYYWTFSKDDFKKVIVDLQKDTRAIDNYKFSSFNMIEHEHEFFEPDQQPSRTNDRSVVWDLLHDLDFEQKREPYAVNPFSAPHLTLALLKQTVFTKLSSDVFPGYYSGQRLPGARPAGVFGGDIYEDALYLYAGSNAINALYIAEILYLRALSLRQKTIEDFGIFAQVKAICKMADDKRRIPSIEEANKVNNSPPDAGEKYYEYAYACARDMRVTRDLFLSAIDLTRPIRGERNEEAHWYRSAEAINKLGIYHPCAGESGDMRPWLEYETRWVVGTDPVIEYALNDLSPIIQYFDFYRFGTLQREKEWYYRVEQAEQKISSKMTEIGNMLKRLMETNLPYADFLCDLDSHCDLELKKRKELHTRYLDIALDVSYPWWEKFDAKSEWERLEPCMEWIAESSEKLGVLFREHFRDLDNIEKINNTLKGAADTLTDFNSRLGHMHDVLTEFNVKIGGKTTKVAWIDSISLDADYRLKLKVTVKGEEAMTGWLMVGITETTGPGTVPTMLADWPHHYGLRFKPIEVPKMIKNYHIKPIPRKFTEWPDWMGAFGDSMALALTIVNLFNDIKDQKNEEGRVEVLWKVAMHTFKSMDSVSNALNATRLYRQKKWAGVSKFAKIGEKCKGPGLYLEAIFNVKEGAPLLVMTEESPTASAYREGDLFEFTLQESKGLVLVASAAPGAVAAGGALLGGETVASAFGLAIPPLGIGLAVGTIAVVIIDIALHYHKGPATIMQQVEEDLDKAVGREFGLFDKERTYDSIEKFSKDTKELLSNWDV
ncbi:MAG: hypothetical protein HY203_09050 [Nitrospirae bacterium]|nr:hypothetical protein [Nitrospirota bacterium]